MKKSVRILAFCLCVCLLCSMMGIASAETGYLLFKQAFADPSNGSIYLGSSPRTISSDTDSEHYLMVCYDTEDENVTLCGKNKSGQTEITWWDNIGFVDGTALIYAFCVNWDDMSGLLDPGYTLALVLDLGDDDSIIIGDAETAALFASTLQEYLGIEK